SLFCKLAASLICKGRGAICHVELAANALQARVALVVTANLLQVRFKFDASNFAMTREYQVKIKLAANLRAIWVIVTMYIKRPFKSIPNYRKIQDFKRPKSFYLDPTLQGT
ncbi:hypothetical protein AVEN_103651-2-1, partial [Araneus ventricosus]